MASYTPGTWTKGHTLSAEDMTSLETRIRNAFTDINSVPYAFDYGGTWESYPDGWVLTTENGSYKWKDPSPGYFHYVAASNTFEYVGPYDTIEEIQQWYTETSNRLGTDMFLFDDRFDSEGWYQSSKIFRLTDIQDIQVTDSYENTFYVWHFVFTRVYYDKTTSQTILQIWTLCPSMDNASTLDQPFVVGQEPSQEEPVNVAMYSERILEGDILSYSKGGTGANSLKTLSQKMFKQCAADGSDDLAVLTTYPVNKPGVYRVGQPNITGLPTGISGYGCLVIFNGGSYWLHMYMDSNNGIYFARKDSTAVPTTWYKATTSSVAAKT